MFSPNPDFGAGLSFMQVVIGYHLIIYFTSVLSNLSVIFFFFDEEWPIFVYHFIFHVSTSFAPLFHCSALIWFYLNVSFTHSITSYIPILTAIVIFFFFLGFRLGFLLVCLLHDHPQSALMLKMCRSRYGKHHWDTHGGRNAHCSYKLNRGWRWWARWSLSLPVETGRSPDRSCCGPSNIHISPRRCG